MRDLSDLKKAVSDLLDRIEVAQSADPTSECEYDDSPFLTINDILEGRTPIGVVATAIERHGVFTWDRFGRFGLADDKAKTRVLDALADIYAYSYSYLIRHLGDEPAYMEKEKDAAIITLQYHGWYSDQCPDFDAIRAGLDMREQPQRKGADTRSRDTMLVLIAAMAGEAGVDLNKRGAAQRIAELTEHNGAPVDGDTVRTVLKLIPEAMDRRTK